MSDHEAVVIDQFTRQAVPFAELPAHSDADIIGLIRDLARLTSQSKVLDVACGPGLVALALAPDVAHVTGLDLTPAMLAKAQELQREKGLTNLSWDAGRADSLPYADGSFDAVLTRYSFHHLLDPRRALAEMIRACRPGGRVVVADVYTTTPEQSAEYDRLERLRDPSHTHALRLEEFRALLSESGLFDIGEAFARLPIGLDELLNSSFSVEGGAGRIREAAIADAGHDRTGLGFHERGGRLFYSFPTVVLAGSRPG